MLNPDAEIPRKFKLKEHHLRDQLLKDYPTMEMVFDRKVDGGCSRRRPDVRIECFTHTIILECDEFGHVNYSCEEKRMMELFQDLGNRPLVMIRFNPDKCGARKGCFENTKSGSLSLNKKEWNSRISELKVLLERHIREIPEKEITLEYLFYHNQ